METLQRLLTQRPVILQLLRFAAIGVLNTAIDFIVLNVISKALGINAGLGLGTINIFGFLAAVIQSYYWNRSWTFDPSQTADAIKNFFRLVVVGGLGFLGLVAVLGGVQFGAEPLYYLLVLAVFLITEIVVWIVFGLSHRPQAVPQGHHVFAAFMVVSIIGLLLNSFLLAVVSSYLAQAGVFHNPDLVKNVAKVIAVVASLIWNFIGYKVMVFKK